MDARTSTIEPDDDRLHDPWAGRPWIIGGIGLLVGLWFHWLGEGLGEQLGDRLESVAAIVPAVALFALAFTLERERWRWCVAYALGIGVLLGLLALWTTAAVPDIGAAWDSDLLVPRFSAGLVFGLLTVPFFQAWHDQGEARRPPWRLRYPTLHDHAWTDVVLFIGGGAFLLLVILLLMLWAALFKLIGIRLFADLFDDGAVMWPVGVAAWGVGVSLLRDWPRVVRPVKRLVLGVLRVLAPVLAAIVLLWIAALPFTGLAPLWATKSATPILLCVMILGLLLANAIIADAPADEPRSRVLRASGRLLGAALLPLGVVAAWSLGLRIAQHGLTPERCYAVMFLGVALLYAATYAGLLGLRWRGWAAAVRPANVVLALVTAGLALLVSTPLADMERLSARNQEARLMEGRVRAEDFDFGALKFQMGPPGREALARIRAAKDRPQPAVIARQLAIVDASTSWWDWQSRFETRDERDATAEALGVFDRTIEIIPAGAIVPPGLREPLLSESQGTARPCFTQFNANRPRDGSSGDAGPGDGGDGADRPVCALAQVDVLPGGGPQWLMLVAPCRQCEAEASLWIETQPGQWRRAAGLAMQTGLNGETLRAGVGPGQLQVRPIPFREVVIGGRSLLIDPRKLVDLPADAATPSPPPSTPPPPPR